MRRLKDESVTKRQAIASARAFLGNYFEHIVKMCNLEPISSWKLWRDSYGNRLRIYKSKLFKINKKDDVSLVNDIYAKSSFDLIYKNSYWLMVLISEDNNYLFWFLGNDGFLRTMSVIDGISKNYPSLLSGFYILKFISENYIKEFDIINNIEEVDFLPTFKVNKGYISICPPENDIVKKIIEEIKID